MTYAKLKEAADLAARISSAESNERRFALRGDNWEFFQNTCPECIVAGAADTGKTWGGMLKLHHACYSHPKLHALLVGNTFHALSDTVVKTFIRVTEGQDVRKYGGETPSKFIYQNGSEIQLAGLDTPDAFLSGEYGMMYVNQAEEISASDWEMLGMRCTGRGTDYPHPQLIGDCNPGSRQHWILDRAAKGTLRLLRATHRDNPELYFADGTPTPGGVKRMAYAKLKEAADLAARISSAESDRGFMDGEVGKDYVDYTHSLQLVARYAPVSAAHAFRAAALAVLDAELADLRRQFDAL